MAPRPRQAATRRDGLTAQRSGNHRAARAIV